MKKLLAFTLIIALTLSVCTGCTGTKEQAAPTQPEAKPVYLTISAAASLKDAAEELKGLYAKKHPYVNITYNFGASGTLQKQIEEGAPADLFISAGKKQMDALAEKDLIVKESRKDLLGNELVLITQKDSKITGFEDLLKPKVEKVSIGTPESVPAGQYAKDALTSMKLWNKLQPKLVLAKDVRQVLTYVETGNVAAGLVYNSDAVTSKDVKVVATAPSDSHKPILYPMAVVKNTKQQKAAKEFAAFLSGEEAARVFEKYGFKAIKK
ncbi:molybdate ABC transporter substrate-binding protein [Desulforamulus hydrothermalis]|uniref:Putative ABC transporter substrate-binding lipoprotein yvgL n=1 Tax=Desulforamulus hydrothermalis Lam5 = DSM 18033 TaxID=1121428 RepID=K8EL04_9FIRM|nr:molybdate ABC transporter substrate-binding protein [Desulforamulus hydrothermalis]CCO09211.1 putative ABC transporter substrate-binding lipoprotein yvgL [Desulforamulus hydrothermalis Lam5 = DSM 18033]SHH10580.1 molybdate transport system substrate-binding protein [Desulforamulus hydrothermalis Lam5 = DSM 18033]